MQIGNIIINDLMYPIKVSHNTQNVTVINSLGEAVIVFFGFEETIITIEIKVFDYDIVKAIKDYISTVVFYRKYVFSIVPDDNIDFGNGLGTPVSVRYWSDELSVINEKKGAYSLSMKFRKEI